MLRPIDRARRDGPLYPGSSRTLRDCIDPKHLLIQIDTAFDFAALTADLTTLYDQRVGRPAIHPEIVLRALLLGSIYQVPSLRQLCERLGENLAWRWFCYLTLDDPVFEHSTLSVFLERVGSHGVQTILGKLTTGLAQAGLISPQVYVDSSLLPANVRTQTLHPRDPGDPPPTPIAGEGIWEAREHTPASETAPAMIRRVRYQDAQGRMPLAGHDPDARWRTIRDRTILGYLDHVIGDRSGFILARSTTAATVADAVAAERLLDQLPLVPASLAADSGYRAGRFRFALGRRGIRAYIPLDAMQQAGSPPEFLDTGDGFLCPTGAWLLPSGFPDADMSVRYTARAADCAPCPLRLECVPPSRHAKLLWASRYRITMRRAKELNATPTYAREQRWRRTVSEGIFARLDRLGGTRARYRGCERINRHGMLTAIAHNLLKALTKRRFWRRGGMVLPRPERRCARPAPAGAPAWPMLTGHPGHMLPQPALP